MEFLSSKTTDVLVSYETHTASKSASLIRITFTIVNRESFSNNDS